MKKSLKELFGRLKGKITGDIPAFIILLDRDTERSCHVHQNVIPKLPICRIIHATDGTTGELDEFLHKEKIIVANYSSATKAKLACSVSHIRTWKLIAAQNLRHAIVLEDDIAVLDGFTAFIRRLIKQVPKDYDLVHLYVHEDRGEWQRQIEHAKDAYVNYIPKWGRSAYLLSRSGANKLLLEFKTITNHGDNQIFEMVKRGRLSIYCAAESRVENLGQLIGQYNGEKFKSNIWPTDS